MSRIVLDLTPEQSDNSRQATLEDRYRAVRAYGRRLEEELPNAREVGLAAYEAIRRTYDAKVARCSRLLQRIERELSGECV